MLFPAAAALQRSDSVYTRGFFPRCFQIYSFGDTTSHGPPQCSGVSKLAENLENSHAGHYVDLHREIRSTVFNFFFSTLRTASVSSSSNRSRTLSVTSSNAHTELRRSANFRASAVWREYRGRQEGIPEFHGPLRIIGRAFSCPRSFPSSFARVLGHHSV